jgi:hypothetical protein
MLAFPFVVLSEFGLFGLLFFFPRAKIIQIFIFCSKLEVLTRIAILWQVFYEHLTSPTKLNGKMISFKKCLTKV